MIEKDFDVAFVADLALREKQVQQNYRPIISVHKWFARRPGTLFRSLLLSEFGTSSLRDTYFRSHHLKDIRVADPFMGGGIPLLEANRLGCDIIGYDINPMAYWIVRQEIEHLDLEAYRNATSALADQLESHVGKYYRTKCTSCGYARAHVKYFLWVKVKTCQVCVKDFDLFSGYLLAEAERHPLNVLVCSKCGELTETADRDSPGLCHACEAPLTRTGPAKRNHCICPHCRIINSYPRRNDGPPRHRMFAIEYHCPACKSTHEGRYFKKPDPDDLDAYRKSQAEWATLNSIFVPEDAIPEGDETDRLHKWGYQYYRQLFNERQLLGLELSCHAIVEHSDERVRNALATNLSDLLRYQNMLCRYDTMALKSLDVFSVHGFPVGLIQCESNLLGIYDKPRKTNIGSGGWTNMVEKYIKAKEYCAQPFEVYYRDRKKVQVPIPGEWIGEQRNGTHPPERRNVALHCQSATSADVIPHSLDAVLTDPPYFGNVQYAELMDFCYVWLRRLVCDDSGAFQLSSTRNVQELTGNSTAGKGLPHFAAGVSNVFSRMACALKPGAPLAFTYHHNALDAYYPIAVSILDAGMACTASLPCPAEMGGSIHINGTGSSIIDTIFVCRSTGLMRRKWLAQSADQIASLVHEDLEQLRAGNVKPTRGDMRCIIYGHLVRLAIWTLRESWDRSLSTEVKLSTVAQQVLALGGLSAVEKHLDGDLKRAPRLQIATMREGHACYELGDDYIPF